ncbi:MAG: PH domain-containing protein [Patescibacteria group bacterium]|nr:PH domain-containing protein [Patescibacteria group bacterium]MCL5431960.1 PH domain-containing protein [Patescibacteria group bacterium]
MPRIKVDDQQPTAPPPAPTPVSVTPPPAKSQLDPELMQKSNSGIFSAFSVQPAVSFNEAEEGEQILLLLRAHIVTNVPWIIISLFSLILPIILLPLFSALGGLGLGAGTGFVFILFWYAVTFTYAFLNFLYWYFNVYMVTDERVIDTDWYSVVVRKVSSCQISKIQDVSSTQVGALAGLFDFGNVEIQTAGEEENFEFENVPHPQLVAKQIQELMQKEELEWEGHGTQ